MKRFAQLFLELDRTNRTSEKLDAVRRYFQDAPPEDAAWGLAFLTGRRPRRAVTSTQLRQWAAEETGLPLWLVEECHAAAGDLSEALALVLPAPTAAAPIPLHRMVRERIAALPDASDEEKRAIVTTTWRELSARERMVWNKLVLGAFRVGVAERLVTRALAQVAGVADAVMAHRLSGHWQPTAETFTQFLRRDELAFDPLRPYPFALAHPLQANPDTLGDPAAWLAEWKWDGLRAQLIRRGRDIALWSRGEELIGDQFPEILAVAADASIDFVLDGEVLAWEGDLPLPFAALQRRIGRRFEQPVLFMDVPVVFMAFDLLELQRADLRSQPLHDRRNALASVASTLSSPALRLSPALELTSWYHARELKDESRAHAAEGLMLKRLDSTYPAGRTRGDWWKWKVDPFTVDAVLIYAQLGSGKRAGLYTDYTFAVWDDRSATGERTLIPFAKAYSGLTDEEIAEVDRFVRTHTLGRHGPVRAVEPTLVFELGFERIAASTRHRSGVAVRFPRILRQRRDKKPEDADTLASLRALLAAQT